MKYLKIFIASVFAFSILFTNQNALANNTTPLPSSLDKKQNEVVSVANVNIYKATVVSENNNNFKISFDLANGQGLQSGVKYGVKLIGKKNGSSYIADEKVYPESLTLYENSTISKEISYIAPSNLSGDYSLWITSKNANSFPFGVAFVKNITLKSSTKGININADSCFLYIDGFQEDYTLSEGVTIRPNENLVLTCNVLNNSDKEIIVNPVFETTYRTLYGDVVEASGGSSNPFTFKSGESKDVYITLPKALKPQAYDVKILLKNDDIISNIIIAHYVLSGASATVQNISLDKDYYLKGETATLSFIWSSSADNFIGSRVSSKINPSFKASIKNAKGNLCAEEINQSIVENNSSKVEVPINILSDCKNPQIFLSIINDDGSILGEHSISVPSKSLPVKNYSFIWYIVVSVLIILFIFIFIKYRKNKKNNDESKFKPLPFHVILPFFVLIALGSFIPFNADAITFPLGQDDNTHADIIVSLDNSVYQPNATITISGGASVTTCANSILDLILTANFNGDEKTLLSGTVSGGSSFANSITFTAPSTQGNYSIKFASSLGSSYSKEFRIDFAVSGDGKCSSDGCSSGYPYDFSQDEYTEYWKCKGYGNGGIDSCSSTRTEANGACGKWMNLCESGDYVDVEDSLPTVNWKCDGIAGGDDSETCSYTPESTTPGCGTGTSTCSGGGFLLYGPHITEKSNSDYYYWTCGLGQPRHSTGSYLCTKEVPAGPRMRGTIDSTNCEIAIGNNSCETTVSWSTTNPVGTSFVKDDYNRTKATSNDGTFNDTISNNSEFYHEYCLYNGSTRLDCTTARASCVSGSSWNGTSKTCVANPINGGWSIPDWSACTASCGSRTSGVATGTQSATRTCTRPAPQYGGSSCSGDATVTQSCSKTCTPNPADPIISGPTALYYDQVGEFSFISTDPNNLKIRYGVDWDPYDNKDEVGEWLPSVIGGQINYVNSGTSQSSKHFWESGRGSIFDGPQTFKVLAQNYNGLNSNWSYFVVTIGNPLCPDGTNNYPYCNRGNDICGPGSSTTPQFSEPIRQFACGGKSSPYNLNSNSPADTNTKWNWSCGTVTTCSAPKFGCRLSYDSNYDLPQYGLSGPNNNRGCSGACENGAKDYPTCTPSIVDSCGEYSTTTPQSSEPTGLSACSGGTLNSSSPLDTTTTWNWSCGTVTNCSAPKYGCRLSYDSNYDLPQYGLSGPNNNRGCSGACENGAKDYPTCTPSIVDSCGSNSTTTPQLNEPTGALACKSGTLNSSSPLDTTSAWNWSCGTVTTCSAPKFGCRLSYDSNYDLPQYGLSGPDNNHGCSGTCENDAKDYPTCTNGAPKLSVEKRPDQYLDIPFGDSQTKVLIIKNIGNIKLTGSTSLTSPVFSITSGPLSFEINPGKTETYEIKYEPSSATSIDSAKIFIVSNGGSEDVDLFGRGAEIVSSGKTFDVGQVPIGVGRVFNFPIKNNSTSTNDVCIYIEESTPFRCKNSTTCELRAKSGENINFPILFKPPSIKIFNSIFKVGYMKSGSCNYLYDVNVKGEGIKPVFNIKES